ncbi:MAG TPA: hypothetical protein VGT61_10865 [Thermomicrobiales bacterium]|jgi:hypothetical protein|nr:hypothetical protein [Thermomicrobiales bacterium]
MDEDCPDPDTRETTGIVVSILVLVLLATLLAAVQLRGDVALSVAAWSLTASAVGGR